MTTGTLSRTPRASTPRPRGIGPRSRGFLGAWRAALRVARRDAWRAKWRSLLVIVLIGLPVLLLSAVDVGWRTYQLSPEQKLARNIGAADLGVRALGARAVVRQTPAGWLDGAGYSATVDATADPDAAPSEAELAKALPAGSRIVPETSAAGSLAVRTKAGVEYVPLTGFDYADPIAAGMITQLSGRAPRNASETAITSQFAHDAGLRVGDTMTSFDGARSFRVVGIVRDGQNRHYVGAYVLPAALASSGEDRQQESSTWLVDTPGPVSWAQVRRLNELGFVAVSRAAYLDPPPASQVPARAYTQSISDSSRASIGLVAGMALLEVVLLAGPAFAVSARRQRRDLALIAATGGRRRDLRNVVLANAVVLGLTAGIVGAIGGTGLTAALMTAFGDRFGQIPGPFDVRPLELLGIAAVSLVTAVLAALFPAWMASRTDVVAALAGRRGQVRIRRHVPVIGLVIVALGVVVALLGAGTGRNVNLILVGVVITELGLIVLTPSLITLASRLGRRLPFAPRLALRDAARNRSTASPAVAAVMASMIGAIAISIVATSNTDLDRRRYEPRLPTNVAYVPISTVAVEGMPPPPSARAVTAALKAGLSTTGVVDVYSPGQPACVARPATAQPCPYTDIELTDPNRPTGAGELRSRYGGSALSQVIVDDGTAVSALFGKAEPRAEAALRAGKAVVVDAAPVKNGTITVQAQADGAVSAKSVTVPAVVVSDGFPAAQLIIPPSVTAKLDGYPPQLTGVLAMLSRHPTTTQRQAVNKTLAELQPDLQIITEDGFHDSTLWQLYVLVGAASLVALGAAAVATALANIDGRADLVTLGAVGASLRTRRIVSMSRAGVIAGLGCLIGTAAGFVPAVAWIKRQTNSLSGIPHGSYGSSPSLRAQLRLVIPWPEIVIAAIGIPAVAVVIAGLLTRSRLPVERRLE
jgi:putative ABC transport system permease protein